MRTVSLHFSVNDYRSGLVQFDTIVPDCRDIAPSISEIVARGREVIKTEANALALLSTMLDASFHDAVRHIMAAKGRVVVTGMGKSGHIARKVAATLSSTGTPAIFVHPAEASHGDLGMLVHGDLLLVFSNSGATPEVQPIVAYASQLGIPMIAVASQPGSPFLVQADVPLLLPKAREACPANLAPTTSSIMMMALGDALAMTVMELRGVSRADFQMLHPGGAIGHRLRPVSAMMHGADALPLVEPDTPMHQVILTMTQKSFGVAGIVNHEGRLIGIITDGDLRRHLAELGDPVITADTVMTRDPVTITANAHAEDALALMNANKITALFVTDDFGYGRPLGIIHIHDFLRLSLI